MDLWQHIGALIAEKTARDFDPATPRSVAGGDINQAVVLGAEAPFYFVKLNRADWRFMFEAEFVALQKIHQTQTIRVPRPLLVDEADGQSFIVLEYLQLSGTAPAKHFAADLAALHQHSASHFGFDCDNTIGSTEQPNPWKSDWVAFFAEHRLAFQLELLQRKGYRELQQPGRDLIQRLPEFFEDYQPKPSLLHGDLWSGNTAADEQGRPVIYDPASYYGDHETDLAMLELFGHPGEAFFQHYHQKFPIDAGYPKRRPLYNLYHILNHLNLFGDSYLAQARQMLKNLL